LSDYGIFVNAEIIYDIDFMKEEYDNNKCAVDKETKRINWDAKLDYGDMNGKYCGVECN